VWASCPDCGEDIARFNDPEVDVKLSAHLATCRRDDRPPKRSCRVAREQVKGGTGSCAGHRDTDTHVRQYESSVTSNNHRKSSSIKTSLHESQDVRATHISRKSVTSMTSLHLHLLIIEYKHGIRHPILCPHGWYNNIG